MSSPEPTTSPLMENVTEPINRLLHEGEVVATEEGKEPVDEGVDPRIIFHHHAGAGVSPIATQQQAPPTSKVSQRWEQLRDEWKHLADAKTSKAEVELAIAEAAVRRALKREELAKDRLALAKQWHQLGEIRPSEEPSKEELKEDERELERQRVKLRERGHVLARMERDGEDDKAALEEEKADMERAWANYQEARKRIEGISTGGKHRK